MQQADEDARQPLESVSGVMMESEPSNTRFVRLSFLPKLKNHLSLSLYLTVTAVD